MTSCSTMHQARAILARQRSNSQAQTKTTSSKPSRLRFGPRLCITPCLFDSRNHAYKLCFNHFLALVCLRLGTRLGTCEPAVMVRFEVSASPARNRKQSSVNNSWQSSASSKAALNSALTSAFSRSTMMSASILAIFSSFFLRYSSLPSQMRFTERSASALILACVWFVLRYSTTVRYFSTAMRYCTFIFSISSTFCSIFLGMVGLVTLTESISIPGAQRLRSRLSAFMSSSSRRSKRSMYISCRVCLLQNWLISWWILSVIQIFSYSSVQFSTVRYTCLRSSLFTTSILSKVTSSPLAVPQGTRSTLSVWIMRSMRMTSCMPGTLKWKPGSMSSLLSTPHSLINPTCPSRIWQNPSSMVTAQATISRQTPASTLIQIIQPLSMA